MKQLPSVNQRRPSKNLDIGIRKKAGVIIREPRSSRENFYASIAAYRMAAAIFINCRRSFDQAFA
jgi:hypothetical protein